jgi:hypothetical protein
MSLDCSKFYKSLLLIAGFLVIGNFSFAQSTNLSPYSRYGLGEINSGGFAFNESMGGLGQALRDRVRVNPLNPASYTSFGNTALEVGLKTQFLNIRTQDESQLLSSTNFNYLAIGLPFTKKWGVVAGLIPFSSIGYNINTTESLPDEGGQVTHNYIGDGGINRVFVGSAYDVINKSDSTVLSLGVNALYNFGNILRVRKSFFPSSPGFLNPQVRNEAVISDWSFESGAQFSFYPNKKKGTQIILGATYGFEANLNANQEQFAFTFTRNASGVETVRDTVSLNRDENGSYIIPARFAVGLGLNFSNKLFVSAEYGAQSWDNFRINFGGEEQNLNLNGSQYVVLGGTYSPYADNPFVTSLAKRIDYSFGFRYEETYLQLRDNQINDVAVSFGLGFPVRRSLSTTRIGLNVVAGSRGTTNNNLIQEQYVNVFFGVTLTPHRAADRWFIRRKYD